MASFISTPLEAMRLRKPLEPQMPNSAASAGSSASRAAAQLTSRPGSLEIEVIPNSGVPQGVIRRS